MKTKLEICEGILFAVLIQACEDKGIIDNQCMSAYEGACEYLTREGYLKKINPRMYKVKK